MSHSGAWPQVRIVRVKKLWPRWVGARVSNRTIYVREDVALTATFLAHELVHIDQRIRLGWKFLFVYVWGWIASSFSWQDHPMEQEAFRGEISDYYRDWARYVLDEHWLSQVAGP